MKKLLGVFLVGSFAVVSAFGEPGAATAVQVETATGTQVATFMQQVVAGKITSATAPAALKMVGGNAALALSAFNAAKAAKDAGSVTNAEMAKFRSAAAKVANGTEAVAKFAELASNGSLKSMDVAQLQKAMVVPSARTNSSTAPAALAVVDDASYFVAEVAKSNVVSTDKVTAAQAALQGNDNAAREVLMRAGKLLKKAQAEGGAHCEVADRAACVGLAVDAVQGAYANGILNVGPSSETLLVGAMDNFGQPGLTTKPFLLGYVAMNGQFADGSIEKNPKLKSCALYGQ